MQTASTPPCFPFMRRLARRAAGFRRDRSGAVAIAVAAAIIPLVGALGLATDAARGYMLKARLSQALDSAALSGGKAMLSPNRDADVQMFFAANFPPGYLGAAVTGPNLTVNPDNTVLGLSASATIDTTFMRVLGINTMTVSASSEVTRQIDQLDIVLTIDTSGSMCSPCSKIDAAKAAAVDLVNILFGSNTVSPTVTIDGTTYNLLNIGLVNWNSKVNIGVIGSAFNSALTQTVPVPTFTNPVTGASQSATYLANNTPVPLLSAPASTWTGGVYARYTGDGNNANDADVLLGPTTVGGAAWIGWEPIPALEGEPRSGSWTSAEGGGSWTGQSRSCNGAYWNDNLNDPNRPNAVGNAPAYWYRALSTINNAGSNDCVARPAVGILPLQQQKATMVNAVNSLSTGGTTNIPQGLAWAWEVLMPGEPFAQALATVPFPRQRAIVLLTDGENHGGNGDSYKGRFGAGTAAGTNTQHGDMPLPDVAGTKNNLNNRLRRLATNVKAMGIKLFVIQFDNTDPTLTALLQSVASEPNAPYYFNAPTAAQLQAAFQEIANNLTNLRLSH